MQITYVCIINSDCNSNPGNDTSCKSSRIIISKMWAFVCTKRYVWKLKARQETLIKYLGRSASEPAFCFNTWKNRIQGAVKKKILARQLDTATWRFLFTSSSGLDHRQEISHTDALFSSVLWPDSDVELSFLLNCSWLVDWSRIDATEVSRRTQQAFASHHATHCGWFSGQKCFLFLVAECWWSSAHVFTTNTALGGLFWIRFDCFQCKILLKMKYQQL